MAYYKFFNKLLPNGSKIIEIIKVDGKIKEILQGNIGTGQFEKVQDDQEFIDDVELTNIIQSRLAQSTQGNQFAFGNSENFLPISALRTLMAKGLRCSSAVCRLVRNYATESGIDEIITNIVFGSKSGLYSREDINAILSIKSDDNFWIEYDQISQDLDNLTFIDKLKQNADFIAKLKSKIGELPVGTGFLVGKNYLLTNHHIIPNRELLKDFKAQFLYEQDSLGIPIPVIEYQLNQDFFVTCQENQKLDYTLVQLEPLSNDEQKKYNLIFNDAGDNFGWLSMCEEFRLIAPPYSIRPPYTIGQTSQQSVMFDQYAEKNSRKLDIHDIPGEPAIIIQHPKGKRKEIVIFNNRVQRIYTDFIQYETSTLPGSSGSAVLTQNWHLVGLHHATLIDDENGYIVGNLGVKICKIIKDLQDQATNKKDINQDLRDFINCYVVLNNQPVVRGRFFLVANYVTKYQEGEPINTVQDICRIIKTKLEAEKFHGFDVILAPENLGDSQQLIEWIEKYDEYKVGDIALQVYVSERHTEDERGTTIFHIANKDERRLHAEILLQSLTNVISELPSQGARSDSGLGQDGIDFCRKLRMPSLRMRLGFFHNQEDWKIITTKSDEIASVIAQGLLAWGDSLSPIPVLPKFEV